jgi:uncharacterized membrane protein YhhN
MLPADVFVGGLLAFLVAHVSFIAGFWVEPPTGLAVVVSAGVVAVVIVPLAARIVRAVRASDEPALALPVVVYIAVIAAMVVSALASGNWVAGTGAVLFAASDSMIAWDRFVAAFRAAPVAIMISYHLGQTLLVLSLLS